MKLDAKVIEKLKGVVSADALAEIQRLLRRPDTVGRKGLGLTCPGCGAKAMRGDTVCGACSELKCQSPRRFWHFVHDRELGGEGRPKLSPPEPRQDILRHEFTGPGIVALGGVPCAASDDTQVESTRFRWLVVSGQGSAIVVAAWKADAVKYAKKRLALGDTAGYRLALRLERTDAPEVKLQSEMVSE